MELILTIGAAYILFVATGIVVVLGFQKGIDWWYFGRPGAFR